MLFLFGVHLLLVIRLSGTDEIPHFLLLHIPAHFSIPARMRRTEPGQVPDDRQRNTSDTSDVEYKENTNTLYIKKQRTYNMEENIPSATAMSEEEIFKRLLEERH